MYWYIYFLRLSNGDIYTGLTHDLKRRLSEHCRGNADFTRNKEPKLIGYEAYLMEDDVRRRERYLKSTEGKRLFNQQYKSILEKVGSSRHTTGRHVE